jgi:hypothetical protein
MQFYGLIDIKVNYKQAKNLLCPTLIKIEIVEIKFTLKLNGGAGNSLLPYRQILVKVILLALIGSKWCILVECINWPYMSLLHQEAPFWSNESRENGFNKNLSVR